VNILHLSNTPLSNAPANLAQIQRESGHTATVLHHRDRNTNKVFVGGHCWPNMEREEIEALFTQTDLIHFHNFAFEQFIFRPEYNGTFGSHLEEIARQKPCLIQYHSPRHSTENFETTIQDPHFKGRRAVVAQYQVRLYPEAEFVVPNAVPINDVRFSPMPARWPAVGALTVSYAPSNTHLRGWDDKGAEKIFPILQHWRHSGRLSADIITNTPFEECLTRKRWAHIGVEELVTGSYHLSLLEYMSMGVATIGNIDRLCREAIARVAGEAAADTLPHIQATADTLPEVLGQLAQDASLTKAFGENCRAWMEKYWNQPFIADYFNKIYRVL
jgi:hypothetical protein